VLTDPFNRFHQALIDIGIVNISTSTSGTKTPPDARYCIAIW
jgi:hypothetical protein